MEKLIRFINEYGHTSNCGPFETCRIEPATEWNSSYLVLSRDDNGEGDWKDWFLEIPRLISKEYGFIKWLVDNNKIDGKKFYEKNILKGFITITKEEKADSIIMNLSISDTPIEDLKSMLVSEYKTYMCRYYDDGHKDNEVLGEFKILKKVYAEAYNGEWIAKRKDGVIGSLKESEVSGMYNPKNGGSRMSFDARGTKEEILSLLD